MVDYVSSLIVAFYVAVPLSINTIYEEVMKGEAGRSMTLDHLRASLVMLGCERGADESYKIGNVASLSF